MSANSLLLLWADGYTAGTGRLLSQCLIQFVLMSDTFAIKREKERKKKEEESGGAFVSASRASPIKRSKAGCAKYTAPVAGSGTNGP